MAKAITFVTSEYHGQTANRNPQDFVSATLSRQLYDDLIQETGWPRNSGSIPMGFGRLLPGPRVGIDYVIVDWQWASDQTDQEVEDVDFS